jgi:hypothetical protein
MQEGGASEDDIIAERVKYRGTSAEYARFSKAMNLPQQRERVTVDGLGNIGVGKYKSTSNTKTPLETVEKSSESGIIKEQNKKPITQITENAINKVPNLQISSYTEEQCKFIQQQHKELLKYSRDNNSGNEVAFVFNSDMSSRKEFTGTDDKVDLGALYGKDLFVMHNHPRNGSFSDTDIVFLLSNDNLKSLSIVKNTGNVEVISKSDTYDRDKLILDFKRQYRKYVKKGTTDEINKAVIKFIDRNREGLFWTKT